MKRPPRKQLSAERLREVLSYDPTTGIFTWVKHNNRAPTGSVAGSYDADGYRNISIDRLPYKAHRLAWLYVYGVEPECQIDHINCVRDDNRIENLRVATHQQNQRNRACKSSSGYKGVYLHKPTGRWNARITTDGRDTSLGYFDTAESAGAAYAKAARERYAEFARF